MNSIDWSQLWYPGPRREFSADELARASGQAPSRTVVTVAMVNFASVAMVLLQAAPASQTASLSALLVALALAGTAAARWLWARPWRRALLQVSLVGLVMMAGFLLLSRPRIPDGDWSAVAGVASVGFAMMLLALWFLVVWCSQQVQSRLAEQAERDRAVEMARRLAAAQIEPHFLFNTLASLQHWVATGDARAATLLDALVGYLRATLPMFQRPLHPLADELQAVRGYLGVMAVRFGPRLRWQLQADEALATTPLPPGLLLTLVENAVVHGIEPRIGGGALTLHARREGAAVVIDVDDDGDGPPPGVADGTGLANCRERLALACGPAATLTLTPRDGGGARARVSLPVKP